MDPTPNVRVKLRQGEVLLKKSRANLQAGFIVPLGGKLLLTNKRLFFLPDRFTIPIRPRKAKDVVLDLVCITGVERVKGDMTNLLAGSFRSRLHVQCNEAAYTFQTWGLDEWVKNLKEAAVNAICPI